MRGDVLDPASELAVRQREAELAGRPLRRTDAGHDLDRNARPPAGRDLLAGAAENHRVAAFEAHHAPARLGERYHQGVDLILLARRLESGLADQHLLCLAA